MENHLSAKLHEVYEALIHVALFQHSYEKLRPHIDDTFMGYGTALDEKLRGWEGFHWMVDRQRKELAENDITINRYPIQKSAFADDRSAMIVEEIEFTFTTEEGPTGFTMRLSTILEYANDRWMIHHFHGSTADADTPEGSAWPIEEWKRRNAELQRIVEKKTSDLKIKNRDLEIEAALERVRSRSMAMQNTNELQEVVQVVAEELTKLGVILDIWGAVICTYFQDSKDVIHWTASDDESHPSVPFLLPYFSDTLFDAAWDSKNRGDDYFAKNFSFEVKNAFFEHAFEHSDYRNLPEDYKKAILETQTHAIAWAWSENSAIMIPSMQGKLPGEEEKEIIIRFASVFEQAYIRFLDLQKAEAQAREAQIEVALERVRARTMAMHKSEELAEISHELFKQVQALGVTTWHCAFNIYDEGQNSSTEWGTNAGGTYPVYKTPREGIFLRYYEIGQTGETLHIERIGEDRSADHYAYLCTLPGVGEQLVKLRDSGVAFPTSQIDHVAYFKYGYLIFITYEEVPEAHDIFCKFAKVFEQSYTRFLDLKKTEEQAREAQIEAALERVRYRAIAMRHSDDLSEAAEILYNEFLKLGVEAFSCGYLINDDANQEWKVWLTNPGEPFFKEFWTAPYEADHHLKARYESWKGKEEFHCDVLEGEENRAHHVVIAKYAPWKSEMLDSLPPRLVFNSSHFTMGHLLVISPDRLTPDLEQAMVRFRWRF